MDADSSGSIDQSEWTKWISEQAATVSGLEDRLRSSIADVQKDLERVGSVEESVSALGARVESSASSFDARLSELSEQQTATTQAAVEKVDARLTVLSQEHTSASEAVTTELASLNERLASEIASLHAAAESSA